MTQGNAALVKEWMTSIEDSSLQLDGHWLTQFQKDFISARVEDADMCETTRQVLRQHDYYIDPHTAVAFEAAKQLGYINDGNDVSEEKNIAAIFATASPCKFEHAVTTALGKHGWDDYVNSTQYPERAKDIMMPEEGTPVKYRFSKGKTLEQVQIEWEAQLRGLIEKLITPGVVKR